VKNVTVTMDERVASWARVRAAEREMSLARFIGEILREHMAEEQSYERAMHEFLAVKPRARSAGRPLPSRDNVHDRAALRR
jgi:hypothetical protein